MSRISRKYIFFIFSLFIPLYLSAEELPIVRNRFQNAYVETVGNKLIVSTGKVERIWKLTGSGLLTIDFKGKKTKGLNMVSNDNLSADWAYYGLIDKNVKGKLVRLTANKAKDENFTSEHIKVVAEFEYPEVNCSVQYVIWVYPDAPGIRTQLFIKGDPSNINVNKQESRGIGFEVVSGVDKNEYDAMAIAGRCVSTTLQGKKEVGVLVKGLDVKKRYKIGFTWWDFQEKGLVQNVYATGVNSKIKIPLVSKTELPGYKKSKKLNEKIIVDLALDTLADDSFVITFESVKGNIAQVSELFIFEQGNRMVDIHSNYKDNIELIRQNKPNGYSLVGYFDCGEPIQGNKMIATGRVDYLPVKLNDVKNLTSIGYYNDTQHRNKANTPILQEECLKINSDINSEIDWANMVRVEREQEGVIIIKESHKCINQYGIDTGGFIVNESGIQNTGTSLFISDLSPERYKWCWATWSICYTGGQEGAELALKQFDRLRYPVNLDRDVYIQANTWGSGRRRDAAMEANVLKELDSQADLGVDIQQVDDGWQTKEWTLRTDWYPEGWKNVLKHAQMKGVRLGLWAAGMSIPYDMLRWHYENGAFETYKLDFVNFKTRQEIDNLINKVRRFIKYTNHQARVNWDLTENNPRFGYFWAKEYGNIFLANRTTDYPESTIYTPYLVLRDVWHISKYTNINKFQISIQNIEMTNPQKSDANQYNHPYSVAIGLVGTPLFFQETHNYSTEARNQIKPLLSSYKENRRDMYNSYVFPIGDEPDNKSWTGFQWFNPDKKIGYLMVFRELYNDLKKKEMTLRFVRGKRLKITNIKNGDVVTELVDESGKLTFTIIQPSGFLYYKYEILD